MDVNQSDVVLNSCNLAIDKDLVRGKFVQELINVDYRVVKGPKK